MIGPRRDEAVNHMSQFNHRLAAAAEVGQAQQFSGYLDKGYVARSHENFSYKGAHFQQALIEYNYTMSHMRVALEWLFEKIDTLSYFILAPRVHIIHSEQCCDSD